MRDARWYCCLMTAMKTILGLEIIATAAHASDTIKTANGLLKGTANPATGVRMFKGIPSAQPWWAICAGRSLNPGDTW